MKIYSMVVGPIETNCYVVLNEDTKECLVIDPGDEAERIISKLEELEAKPAAILLTHGHHDHILAVDAVRERFKVPVLAMKDEEKLLSDPSLNLSPNHGRGVAVRADRLLEDGEELELAGLEIKALHTPGHTSGGGSYYIEKAGILFSGDTLFRMSVGRTDFATGNMETLIRSIRTKLLVLPDDTRVFPGHNEPTTIGFEKEFNYFLN